MIWWKLKGDGEVKLGKIFAPLDKRLSFSFHSIFFRETLESLRIVGGCVYHWIWNLAKIKEGGNAARGQISIMSTIIHFQDRSKQCYVVLWCCLHYDACGAPLIHGSSFVLATLGTFLIHASAVCTNMFTGSVQQHFPVIDWRGAWLQTNSSLKQNSGDMHDRKSRYTANSCCLMFILPLIKG